MCLDPQSVLYTAPFPLVVSFFVSPVAAAVVVARSYYLCLPRRSILKVSQKLPVGDQNECPVMYLGCMLLVQIHLCNKEV